MKRLALLLIVLSLTASRAVAAGEILAAYETLASSGGIAVFDADTLRVVKLFPTSSPVTAVAYHAINGTIEDIEGTAFVDRNAATGAIIPPGQTNADQYSNRDLASYQNTSFRLYTNAGTMDAQHPLTLIEREEPNNTITNSAEPISNITAGDPTGFGPSLDGLLYGAAGDHLDAARTYPFFLPLLTGPPIPAVFGTLGPLAFGDPYVYAAFAGPTGMGVAAFDRLTMTYVPPLSFLTTSEPGGLAAANGSLYDSEFGRLYRRDPATGAILGSSLSLSIILGSLSYSPLAPPIAGDYNGDGQVDAADYTVWRDTLGQHALVLAADGDFNGMIDSGDYNVWKIIFGKQRRQRAGATAAIPEPASLWMFLAGILTMCCRQRRLIVNSSPSDDIPTIHRFRNGSEGNDPDGSGHRDGPCHRRSKTHRPATSDTDFPSRKLISAAGLTLGGRSGRKSRHQTKVSEPPSFRID